MNVSGSSRLWRRRWTVIGSAAVAAALGLAIAVWIGGPSRISQVPEPVKSPEVAAPPVGRPAPDFTLPLFTGGTLSLHSLRGKPVVLNFWASWCVPCREETPLLVRLHKIYGPRIVFVGVNVEDEDQDARRFLAQYTVDYPAVRSSDERVVIAYAVMGLPTTVFIGADGVVADKYVGGFVGPEGEKALRLRLERLLGPGAP